MELKRLNVAPAKETQFHKKGIFSVEDLVQYIPKKYNDFTKETEVLPESDVSCLVIRAERIKEYYGRTPCVRIQGTIVKTGQSVSIVWFHQNYLYKKLKSLMGKLFYVAGKVSYSAQFNSFSILAPELFELFTDEAKQIQPVYSKVPGMSDEYLKGKIHDAFSISAVTSETIPHEIAAKYCTVSRRDALYYLHNPKSQTQIDMGRQRVIFDDLLYFAMHNEWAQQTAVPDSPCVISTDHLVQQLKSSLPYELTKDQEGTLASILSDFKEKRRVHALIQGDVGCGKTILAILAMVAVAENGYQAVLMAPTQVLAKQHYEEIVRLAEPLGFRTVMLDANLKAAEKKKVLSAIETGEADFVVGTHSVIVDSVVYHNLALTITDEEHKFGVEQRAALVKKAQAGVHSMTMSATPIPRSLAQCLYGNMIQIYNIRTMPAGRKPVITGISSGREKIYRFILREAKAGHQAYVVCPLIDPSEKLADVKSVETISQEYEVALKPYGIRIATLTGRNKKEETEEIIRQFKNGELDVLISTTVIEVGVNVPTATLMIISNAERFGLASLHQLRGRVGRSDLQAYCVLESNDQTEKGLQRLQAMCATNDGFEIAAVDLKIRGAGDFLGTRQAGENKYMTLMMAYPDEYAAAQKAAREILKNNMKCPLLQRVCTEQHQANGC